MGDPVTSSIKETSSSETGGTTQQTKPPAEDNKKFLIKTLILGALISISLIPTTLFFCGKVDVNGFKDIILTFGSIFGAPMGIILNNYFKEGGN